MPTFQKLSTEEVAAIGRTQKARVDLTEYLDFLQDLSPGEGGELRLQEEDKIRVVKRRLSMAATQLQKKIRWRPLRDGALRFEVR
jgi:hypothetical protein